MLQQIVLGGVAQGCVYGLIALGFVLIYKATEVINFAQGELMMLGAFATQAAMSIFHFPFVWAALSAIGLMAVVGLVVERVVIRPVLGQASFSIVMVTFGLAYVARGGVAMIPGLGTETHVLQVPYKGYNLHVAGLTLSSEHWVILATTAALCLLLWMIFRFTRIGIAMQATSQNQLAAYYMGIPVERLNGLVWALAAAVAAIAGILLAPLTFVHANMGSIGIKAFPAAVVGGLTSLPGAIAGGIVIGVTEALSGFYLPEGIKDVAAYLLVIVVLAIKPTGLFGETARKKV